MWKLERGETFLPRVSLQRLQNLCAVEVKAKPKLRLLCAIQRKKGGSLDEIARSLELPKRTVHGCLTRLQERGLSAKESVKQTGRPPMLSMKRLLKLEKDLEKGPANQNDGLWDTKQVREHLQKKYGVTYTPQHLGRLMKKLGYSIQTPRPRHYKASVAEQKRFKKKQENLPQNTGKKVLLSRAWMKAPSV